MPIRSPSTRTTLPKCPMIPGKLFLLLYFWSFRICSHIFLSKHHSRAPRPRPLRTTRLTTFSTSPAGSFEIVKKKNHSGKKKDYRTRKKRRGLFVCVRRDGWKEDACPGGESEFYFSLAKKLFLVSSKTLSTATSSSYSIAGPRGVEEK